MNPPFWDGPPDPKPMTSAEALAELRDALVLLEGWINRYSPKAYRAEHLRDLSAKQAAFERLESIVLERWTNGINGRETF